MMRGVVNEGNVLSSTSMYVLASFRNRGPHLGTYVMYPPHLLLCTSSGALRPAPYSEWI